MKLLLLIPTTISLLSSCSSQHGRIVSVNHLAGYEGGGSLSTLWYYGSDSKFHYFRHLNKISMPYRIRRSNLTLPKEEDFDGYDQGSLITRQLSDYIEKAEQISAEGSTDEYAR